MLLGSTSSHQRSRATDASALNLRWHVVVAGRLMAEPTAASAGAHGADRLFVDNRDVAPLEAYDVDKELVVD